MRDEHGITYVNPQRGTLAAGKYIPKSKRLDNMAIMPNIHLSQSTKAHSDECKALGKM